MKFALKTLLWFAGIVIFLILGLTVFIFLTWDKTYEAEYPAIQASSDSTLIARGKYLAYGPAHCVACHIPKEQLEAMERGEQLALIGGSVFDFEPGKIVTPNLTPDPETGIGGRTDGELARVLRYSVSHNGKVVFPFMPFQNMSDEDLTALISFLRSQAPVNHPVPASEYSFIGKAVMAFGLLKPEQPSGTPPTKIAIEPTAVYGEYLANSVANCVGCHSPRDLMSGAFIGPKFSGGLQLLEPNGHTYVTPNLTPDLETGVLAKWTEDAFVERIKAGRVVEGSPMPWANFAQMDELDLRAIYRYLKTLEPVYNKVEKTDYAPGETPPS